MFLVGNLRVNEHEILIAIRRTSTIHTGRFFKVTLFVWQGVTTN